MTLHGTTAARPTLAQLERGYTMFTVTVTIGRNDGPATREARSAVPMSLEIWDAFQTDVRASLDVVYGTGTGVGEWDGITEDTFLAVGLVSDLGRVKTRLAELAADYRQDAIGLVTQVGTDTQVRATR